MAVAFDSPYSYEELVMPPLVGVAIGAVCAVGASAYIGAPTAAIVFRGLLGGLLGWLYSLCQQRASVLGYLLVGLSYAILIWLFWNLALSAVQAMTHEAVRRPPIPPFLCITEPLAIGSILLTLLRKSNVAVLPKD